MAPSEPKQDDDGSGSVRAGPVVVPAVLYDFAQLFNERRFWDSHEVLEGPWRRGGSRFYKGLILYASAWVHWTRGNRHGVLAQLDKARRVLDDYEPTYLGVPVGALLEAGEALAAVAASRPPEEWLDHVRPPRFAVSADGIRGTEPELED